MMKERIIRSKHGKARAITKTIGKTTLRRWKAYLSDVLSAANFEHANFDPFKKKKKITDFIKAKTATYRAAWITPPLEKVIEEIVAYLESKD